MENFGIGLGGLEVHITYDMFGESWTFSNTNGTIDVYTRHEAVKLRTQLEELGADIKSTFIPYEGYEGFDCDPSRMV